ncbi:hypothetical protein [Arhodomonas sp. AD133]|uniref:hypothetical protein n=1 Tax=Arhodomonas sp. AD133 TaxID=3415009 RepID=UPI003EBFF151
MEHALTETDLKELRATVKEAADSATWAALAGDGTAEKLIALIDRELARKEKARRASTVEPEEIDELPPELISQLSLSKSDREEMKIVQVLNDAGGTLSLDRLLIELYRATRDIYQRRQLTQRLYRMISKGMVRAVPGRKGVYTTDPGETEEET